MSSRPDLSVNIAQVVLDRFGGNIARMAEMTGHTQPRIHGWIKSGTIHDAWRPGLLEAAKRHGVPHTPWDYIAHLADLAA